VLFVPDGLRALLVNNETAPAMAALRDRGVNFANPHSLFPTFTTANASAMATGHYLGDTGNFANTIYTVFPVRGARPSVTPFLEHDTALGDMDRDFGGNYLNDVTVLKAAREAGFRTASVGKLGPTLIFDHTDRTGEGTIVFDDSTGGSTGIPLSEKVRNALASAGLPVQTPSRGENGRTGTSTTPGTKVPNSTQQDYFVNVATKVILPIFKQDDVPFVLVFWSRDPDGTQHNQGDSLNELQPGINGPASLAGVRNADDDLSRIERALADLGLADTTDIIVSADHGFSTISKQSETSAAARASYEGVPDGFLPPGFLALDLAAALQMPLFAADENNRPVGPGTYPSRGDALLGPDPQHPQVVVAGNGGADLLYVPSHDKRLVERVVAAMAAQDYVSGIFVDDVYGAVAGTLPLSVVGLKGAARTPQPAIVVSFTSYSTGCAQPVLCAAEVSDTNLQQGQGMHGSFSRADTMNFMAAAGPDFKPGYVDQLPASNADVGRTMAHLLGLRTNPQGLLRGRVLTEALEGGYPTAVTSQMLRAKTSAGAIRTELHFQFVEGTRYFDIAGTPGRTLGLGDMSLKP
jgi:hypothetical protein